MPNLLPSTPLRAVPARRTVAYPRSYLWDFKKGDFQLDGRGRPIACDGWTAWAQWCVKAATTFRYAALAHGPWYGVELDRLPQNVPRTVVEAEVERTVAEALTIDPRTGNVAGFQFSWRGDAVAVSFVVTPTIGPPIRVDLDVAFPSS